MSGRCYLSLIVLLALASPLFSFADQNEVKQKGVDALVAMLREGDGAARRQAILEIANRGDEAKAVLPDLRTALRDGDPEVRAAAVLALGSLRMEPGDSIPALVDMLADQAPSPAGPINIAAGWALGQFGRPALPALVQAIQQDSLAIRYAAGVALYEIGPEAAPAVPLLKPLVEHDDDNLRRMALAVLREIGPASINAMPEMMKALVHEDFHTQYWACRALGALGEGAEPAVPALKDRMINGAASVRRNAAAALGDIGPAIGQPGVDALVQAMSDFSQPVREQAVIALGKLAPLSNSAVPTIEAALRAGPSKLSARSAAAKTLWALAPDSDLPGKVLLEELQCNEREPWAAAAVLAEIGPQLGVIPQVIKALEDPCPEIRTFAADALAGMGPAAAEAKPALRRLLDDESEDVRAAARDALDAIQRTGDAKGSDDSPSVPRLNLPED